MVDEPRDFLKKICSELVEMSTFGKQAECCGGGGGVLVTDKELSLKLAEKRVEQAIETGAEVLTTLCPTCELNLKDAAEKHNGKIKVVNLLDLLYDSMM